MEHKLEMTLVLTIKGRTPEEILAFKAACWDRDFIRGGPLVVTAVGIEECGITSAVATSIIPILEKDKVR